MSVIGPRPGLWNQDVLTAERDKYGANNVKPGLTGWAQINGRDELEIPVKAKLDGEYVQKESLLFDIECFFKTVGKVVKDDSVVEGGTGEKKKHEGEMPSDEKKKILVICQYYKPEPFRISDICEEMVRRGHEVQVVTGYPNYPEGILYEGYGRGKHIDEVINGVKVHRCYTVPRQTGTMKRMMNYYSYVASSTRYVLSKACVASDGKPFDVVFCNQLSPVMMADAAIAYKRKHKVPVVMYCLDLWPESLIAGGITRESVIYKYYHHVSKNIYRQMDKILITSRMFSDYLKDEFGIKKCKIEYLPQYAEGIFEQMDALLIQLLKNEDNSYVIVTSSDTTKVTCEQLSDAKHYFVPGGIPVLYKRDAETAKKEWRGIFETEKPDLIQIWGTEYSHSVFGLEVAKEMMIPSVIYIQGVMKAIARYATGNVPFWEMLKYTTFRDIYRWQPLFLQEKWFLKRAKIEEKILALSGNVIIENKWAESFCKSINPQLGVYKIPLNISEEFYKVSWNVQEMERHSIVCNASGPAYKGLVCVWILSHFLVLNNLAKLCLLTVVGAVVYTGISWLLKMEGFMFLLQMLKDKVKK